jgi:hypothetical protein
MKVIVDGVEKYLSVINRFGNVDYSKPLLTAGSMLTFNENNDIVLSQGEYDWWVQVLQIMQQSEDIRYGIRDEVDSQEVSDYIYEETKYLMETKAIAETELIALNELTEALQHKDISWLEENKFPKTIEILQKK